MRALPLCCRHARARHALRCCFKSVILRLRHAAAAELAPEQPLLRACVCCRRFIYAAICQILIRYTLYDTDDASALLRWLYDAAPPMPRAMLY